MTLRSVMLANRGAAILLLVAVSLGGCVTPMNYPNPPVGALTQDGPKYDDALKYVDDARTALVAKLKDVDQLETLTKVGVGGGLAGAAGSAAFGAKPKVVLGFLTAAALGYSANSSTDPHMLGEVLNAGLDNLDCIESAGEQANVALAGQRYVMTQHREVINVPLQQLKSDILKASTDKTVAAQTLTIARQSAAVGDEALGTINFYLTHNPVSGAMIRATRRTITQVNQQMRERSPSINTIAQSGSIVGTFITGGGNIVTSAQASAAQIANRTVTKGSNGNMTGILDGDQNALKAALQSVGEVAMPQINLAAVSACQTQFAAEVPMALAFAAPVELTAGQSRDLSVVSHASVRPQWVSATPSDVNWSQDLGVLTLTARTDAKDGSYSLRLTDYSGHLSDPFALNVHAAAAGTPKGQDSGNTIKPPPPPPPGH